MCSGAHPLAAGVSQMTWRARRCSCAAAPVTTSRAACCPSTAASPARCGRYPAMQGRVAPRQVVVGQPGSVGVVGTQFVDFTEPLPLDSGRNLTEFRLAYETYGSLTPARDNVILVCHALSGDAHAAGWAEQSDAPSAVDGIGADERGIQPRGGLGWWDGMIGPGKAFDTDQHFVVCANLIGSCRGSTGPGSINPATGRPYGPEFPVLTVADMVRAEKRLLDHLGIERLLAI